MSGYLIYHYNVLDAKRIQELGPMTLPALQRFEGTLVVASGVRYVEGDSYSNMVVYRFPSMEIARAFYESEEIQRAAKLRHEVTEGIVMFLPEWSEQPGS